jgi:ATP/maltotriose-dependent transcriptional regulator MalT
VWLQEADTLATDDGERARIAGVRGMCLSDGADSAGALAQLDHSVQLAGRVGDRRQCAWSLSMVGRVLVRRGEPERAAAVLDRSLEIAGDQGWTAFRPWPAAFRAEAAIGLGDLSGARELLDAAWVLATETGDHCWIATVAGSQAVLAVAEGDDARGRDWCHRGLAPAPWYLWPRARLLDLACSVALRTAPETAGRLIDALTDLAGRGCMTDLLVAAHLHRAHAGSPTALAAAHALAAGLDDPVLRRRLQRAS